jgi:hypothetical protein
MAAELELLFIEKQVEAARLSASLTEPFATGGEPIDGARLAKLCLGVSARLKDALKGLSALDASDVLEAGTEAQVKGRIGTCAAEIARAAQDFAAQIRFYDAMNPGAAQHTKAVLDEFEDIERQTRDLSQSGAEEVEEGAELAPAEETGQEPKMDDDFDPMLM